MIILLTLMWIFSLDTSQCVSFSYTSISCLENYKLNRTNQDKLTCTGEHIVNHCIPDDQQREVEVCVQMKWIIKGYCPYYDTFSDAIKERHCSLYCLRKDNSQDICICPSSFNDALCTKKCGENFLSDKYVSCEHGGVSTEISPTSGGHDTRQSTESPVDFSTTPDAAFGINGTITPPESQFDGSALGTTLGMIMPLILLVVVIGIFLFRERSNSQGTSEEEPPVERDEVATLLSTGTKYQEENEQNDKQHKGTSKEEPTVESGEGEALLSTGTKCQEENEQNDKQHEDERTSKEAKESSPLLAGNTNQNQSEGHHHEDSVKNGDTSEVNKLDSSQKNDSFLTPPTSPSSAPATAQDIPTKLVDDEGEEKKDEEKPEGRQNSEEGASPGTSKEESPVERGEVEALLSTGTKYQEENEQNDKQHKDERTVTEAMESSPLLAGNTNENQSQEESVKNGDTSEVNKLDSSQKNDPFQTPPTSPSTAPATAQDILANDVIVAEEKKKEGSKGTSPPPDEMLSDNGMKVLAVNDKEEENMVEISEGNENDREENEEDTSKETERKEVVGVFVNSLESIEKEDDEEGGSSELHALLEYMCTGAAKKILFNVTKMYVDNPDSYFHDGPKKASVRALLPPEYHSAINPESEYRHSIPVIYAILQLSLSAQHQPKSGWGQEVKDTDTGVGDDVERVYKVHMLSREIHTPEEISVDGYVRLFEMLIGAVERLDIKEKCSEDYKEIVRRWENIQKKQWMKDKWNTFTNFTKKWSE